jgi:hypothetical protein
MLIKLKLLEEKKMNFNMTEMELKKIAQSRFVGYTIARLDKWYDIFTDVITDSKATNAEIMQAAKEREELQLCINLFLEINRVNPNFIGRTPCDVIEKDLGLSIDKLQKQTGGGLLAQDIVDKTGSAFKTTIDVTKKTTNSFANWLANKTGGRN